MSLIDLIEQPPAVSPAVPSLASILVTNRPLILRAFDGEFAEIVISSRVKTIIEDINRIDMGSLNKITETIADIVQDGILNEDDFPHLIELATFVYTLVASKKSSFKGKGYTQQIIVCSDLLKYLLRLYIQEGDVDIDDDKKDAFLARVNILVDLCISLMKVTVRPSWVSCCGC